MFTSPKDDCDVLYRFDQKMIKVIHQDVSNMQQSYCHLREDFEALKKKPLNPERNCKDCKDIKDEVAAQASLLMLFQLVRHLNQRMHLVLIASINK